MNRYEEKQQARKERLEDRAAKLESTAQATLERGLKMSEAIPFGQPILVGHHSEGRDRRYRKRIDATIGKSVDMHKAAEATAQRAASVGLGGISSDDPDAIDKLEAEHDRIVAERDRMKAVNAAWRKAGKPAVDDAEGWDKIASAVGSTLRAQAARFVMRNSPVWSGQQPFEAYELSNRSANIKRIKDRIATLERQQEAETVERMVGDVKVSEDPDDNRLRLYFPGKPDAEMRGRLKASGFRWSPSVGAWQRHLNNAARYAAKRVLEEAQP